MGLTAWFSPRGVFSSGEAAHITPRTGRKPAATHLPQCIRGSTVFGWTCFYQFLDNAISAVWSILHDLHISINSFIRVLKASRTSVPLRSDFTSRLTSVSHCHDTRLGP
jgi:hypothetical protein